MILLVLGVLALVAACLLLAEPRDRDEVSMDRFREHRSAMARLGRRRVDPLAREDHDAG